MIKDRFIKIVFIVISILLFTGCVSSKPSLIKQNINLGKFKKVAVEADTQKELDSDLDESNQLPTLYAGNSYLYSNKYKKSLQRLDEAERIVKFHNEEMLLGSTGDLIAKHIRKNLRSDAEFNQQTVASKGQMIAPDLSLSGKIIQRNITVDKSTQQVEYYFQMSLTDINTGLAMWEDEKVIGKRGSNKSVAW